MLIVCSFFWVDEARNRQYRISPEDVRIWDRMVARHLTVPHRRVCVTHRPDLINFMETAPLDMAKHVPGLCTVKLMVWRPDIAKVLGDRILLMDVDCVVTGSMDAIVSRREEAVFWRNPNFTEDGKRGFYQGSMQLLTAGARPFLWDEFDPNVTPGWLNRRFGGGEQAWLSERLNFDYPGQGWHWGEACWTEADGVYGAGRLMGGQMGAGVQSDLPENARVVFTPGDRSPSQPEMQARHPWIASHYH